MKKIGIIILILGMSTTSIAVASCHKEPTEVKNKMEQVQGGRQPSSIEHEQKAQKHEEYLEKLDQGATK